jgi:hypothetical protein
MVQLMSHRGWRFTSRRRRAKVVGESGISNGRAACAVRAHDSAEWDFAESPRCLVGGTLGREARIRVNLGHQWQNHFLGHRLLLSVEITAALADATARNGSDCGLDLLLGPGLA